jgi:anaerobic selenocysteine-containing dehydrogenase
LAHGKPVGIETALTAVSSAIAACGTRESVAIFDPRPGRAASQIYRRFLAGLPQGIHCAPRDAQPSGFGIDLENTRAILSFGAPVLDGWLSPGRVLANRSHFQLIQVEPAYSRTASLADLWVPLLPGSEDVFAAAVARALKGEAADPHATEVARILLRNKPAIAVGSGAAVAHLNTILGSIGRPGGFLPRRDFTPATDIAAVPDGSIRVLLVEEAAGGDPLPWNLLRPKLAPRNSVVVALTPWLDGCAQHADYVIPSPMYLESLDEAPTPAGSTVAGFSLSPALLTAPSKLTAPAEFVLRLAHDSATYPDILKQRVAAIKKEGRGAVFTYADAKSTPVRDIPDLWKTMLTGAAWFDDSRTGLRPVHLPSRAIGTTPNPTPEYPLILIPAETPPPHGSPLMSKLYRESGLRRPANAATVNPQTARAHALDDGDRAKVKTPTAEYPVQIILDPAIMPGIIQMAAQKVEPASIRRA